MHFDNNISKKYIFLIIFLFTVINSFAQNVTWEKFIPGRLYKDEWANDICQTTDGNFVVVGAAIDTAWTQVEVVKINGFGDTLWLLRYYPVNSTGAYANGCLATENGSCIVTGSIRDSNTTFLSKIDENGNIIWDKKYNSFGITYYGLQVQRAVDGGFIINGIDFIMKTDSLGNHNWHRHRLEFGYSNFLALELGHTGGFYSIYNKLSFPTVSVGVTKWDENGNFIWQKEIPKAYQEPTIIKKLSNGYLLMGTNRKEYYANSYLYTFKMNDSGVFSSYKMIPLNQREEYEFAGNIINDNRFVFATNTQQQADTQYLNLRIVDSSGNILRHTQIKSYVWGTYYFRYRVCTSVISLSNGYLMFGGYGYIKPLDANEDFYVIRTDTNLFFKPIIITSNESLIPESFKLYQNFPNPFNSITKIKFDLNSEFINHELVVKLKIYDALGRDLGILLNEILKPGTYEVTFDGSKLPSGIYFYKLQIEDFSKVKKMILIK